MPRARNTRTYSLRRASSVVFALISILPLLLFAYTLHALDALQHHVAQIGLGSALVLSMIGFYIYSTMVSQMSDILRDLEAEESPRLPAAESPPLPAAAGGRGDSSASRSRRMSDICDIMVE